MEFWRRKKEALEGGEEGRSERPSRRGRSTSLAVRPIPDDALIIVPMRNTVTFPGVLAPVAVGRSSSVAAVNEVVRQSRKIGFLLQRDPKTDTIAPDDLHWVGTAGEIVRYVPASEGAHHLAVQGQSRFRVTEFLEGWAFLVARVVWVPEATGGGEAVHKETCIPFLDSLDEEAAAIGAVNTITHSSGLLTGHNTDGRGFAMSLQEQGISTTGAKALIIGAGGASRAVGHYLSRTCTVLHIY